MWPQIRRGIAPAAHSLSIDQHQLLSTFQFMPFIYLYAAVHVEFVLSRIHGSGDKRAFLYINNQIRASFIHDGSPPAYGRFVLANSSSTSRTSGINS